MGAFLFCFLVRKSILFQIRHKKLFEAVTAFIFPYPSTIITAELNFSFVRKMGGKGSAITERDLNCVSSTHCGLLRKLGPPSLNPWVFGLYSKPAFRTLFLIIM